MYSCDMEYETTAPPLRRGALIGAASGLVLAAATFCPHWSGQLLAPLALAPVFWLLARVRARHAYAVGACFALAWLVPTTYWYYSFMPVGVAVGASIGWALLQANLFHLAALRDRIGVPGVWLAFSAAWVVLTWARMRLPVTEDWWIPHLGYGVWRNPGLVWLGGFGGEAALEGAVLLGGAVVAWALLRSSARAAALAFGGVALAVVCLDAVAWNLPARPIPPALALQQMTRGGVDAPATEEDVDSLMAATLAAAGAAPAQGTTVVWPENSVPASAHARIAAFASDNGVNIVYHTAEADGGAVYKKTVVIDASTGREALSNYKKHLAPDEEVGEPRDTSNTADLSGHRATSYICYDLHYPDAVKRLRGAQVAYVPLDDAAYGYLQKQFHAADIALHAAQAGTAVVVAATDGPTMAVNSNGVVVEELVGTAPGHVAVP